MLALEYALKHPTQVSHIILMNPAPASAAQLGVLRASYVAQLGSDMDRQREIMATAAYKEGDPATVAARYGALADVHAHFLTGDASWFTSTIEPSLRGASEVRRIFLRQVLGELERS